MRIPKEFKSRLLFEYHVVISCVRTVAKDSTDTRPSKTWFLVICRVHKYMIDRS